MVLTQTKTVKYTKNNDFDMGRFRAVSKAEGERNPDAIDVSSYGKHPYNLLSPHSFSSKFRIPVPGQRSLYAHSVEGVWQGLKLVDGKIDTSFFVRKPKKRKGVVEGHKLGDKSLDYLAAREKIFKPAYFYHLQHNIPQAVKDTLVERALSSQVLFYDVNENVNPTNPSLPLSHSVYLSKFFDDEFSARLVRARRIIDGCYTAQELEHETLAEPLARAVSSYEKANPLEKKLILEAIRVASADFEFFKKRFYNRLEEELINQLTTTH